MNIEAKDILNFALGLYGSAVASWVAFSNRGRLKVEAAVNTKSEDPYLTERDGDWTVSTRKGMLRVVVTNTGKRPVER